MADLDKLSGDYLNILLKSFSFLDHCNILLFDENMARFRKIFPYFYKIPCVGLFYASLTLFLIKIFNGNMAFDELARVTAVYVLHTQTLCRAAIIVSKKKEIRAIFIQLGNIWRTTDLSEEQIMKKNALLKQLNFRYAVFYWMCLIGAWEYTMAPILESLFRIYIMQEEYELLLPFDCVFPFDPKRNWFLYIAVYIFEVYSIFHVVYCYVGSEILVMVFSSHLSTEFTMLQYDVINIIPEIDNTRRNENNIYGDENIRNLIRKHQELIRLTEELDNVFNIIIFMNLSCATIMICFFALSAVIARGAFAILQNFIALLSGTYPIYNICYHAELIKEASETIGYAAYQNLWYNGNQKHKMAIWFIMKRSQNACGLTSLKYNKIALSTFMTVMSTTWSYFSLASSVYEDK